MGYLAIEKGRREGGEAPITVEEADVQAMDWPTQQQYLNPKSVQQPKHLWCNVYRQGGFSLFIPVVLASLRGPASRWNRA